MLKSFASHVFHTIRSTSNCHGYICFGNHGVQLLNTNRKDMEYLVSQWLGRGALVGLSAVLAIGVLTSSSWALPVGSQVVNGEASFTQQGNTLHIDVPTQKSIINHQSFNIAANERVNFRFAQSNSISLNRVLDGNPTQILGRLTGNGTIMLLNPAGVVFGAGSTVNVGGLTASTLGMTDANFLAGNYTLTNGGKAGAVINNGNITSQSSVVLAGRQVSNTGIIRAAKGNVRLAVGETVTLAAADGIFTEVEIDKGLSKKLN